MEITSLNFRVSLKQNLTTVLFPLYVGRKGDNGWKYYDLSETNG